MNYNFTILDPIEFEELVCDLFSEEFKENIESFKVGKDKGIDLRHICRNTKKTTIFQCKRYGEDQFKNLKNSLQKEKEKIKELKPERYILATSVPLSPDNKDELFEILKPWCKSKSDIFGKNDLNSILSRHSKVLNKHFKLWISSTEVLDRILHSKTVNYTENEIESFVGELQKIVIHEGFYECMDIIEKYNHVLISGNPGIGKTTVAKLMLLNFMTDGFDPVIVTADIDDAWSLLHKAKNKERKLVLLYDDFLGRTEFNKEKLKKNEDKMIVDLISHCEKSSNIKLILTTREYIFEDAKRQNGALHENENEFEKYSIKLNNYNKKNKALILFNHLYFSNLPETKLNLIVESEIYKKLVSHKNYNPRIIAFFCNNKIAKQYSDDNYLKYVEKTFENPREIWEKPFYDDISDTARKLLLILLSLNGNSSLGQLETLASKAVKAPSQISSKKDFMHSLKQLEGSFTKSKRIRSEEEEEFIVEFENPSIEDFLTHYVRINPDSIIDIEDSIIYFNQISNLMRFLVTKKTPNSKEKETLNLLLQKIEDTSTNFKMRPSAYSFRKDLSWYPEVISIFGIFHTKISITELLQRDLPQGFLNEMLSSSFWVKKISESKSSVRAVPQLNGLTTYVFESDFYDETEKERFESALREAVLEEDIASKLVYDLHDIVNLEYALTKTKRYLNNDQVLVLEQIASDEFSEEVLQSDDLDELEENLALLEGSCLVFSSLASEVEDRIEELQEEQGLDDDRPSVSSRQKEDKNSEVDLDDLFSKLVGD